MQGRAGLLLLLGASAATANAQVAPPLAAPGQMIQTLPTPGTAAPSYGPTVSSPIAADIDQWNALRQSDTQPFSSYATFLLNHRGWPGEAAMRRTAEQKVSRESAYAADVLRFFTAFPPTTPAGHAALAFALQGSGRAAEAREEARRAWIGGVLPVDVEQRVLSTFGSGFAPADHELRMEVLLGNGDSQSAARQLVWAPVYKRATYQARLALQTRAPDAAEQMAALDSSSRRDAGVLLDQVVWMRNSGQSAAARQMLAGRPTFERPPASPARYLDTALTLARGAVNDSQWSVAYGIASKLEDLYPAGTDVSDRPYDERDDYTSLAWLGGTTALFRLGRPADAARLFDLYGRAARSPQTRAKGFYWAARAATAAGNAAQANVWLEQAAQNPDQFYGQLALERLGRTPTPPPSPEPVDVAERAAFNAMPLVQAIRYLGSVGRRSDQTTFVRALAAHLDNDRDRVLAGELGRAIGRLDLGVWAAREARTNGDTFYAAPAFPLVPLPPAYSRYWAFAHGIIRQESSFERTAVSGAGARGLMQLMPGTARQTASRLGVGYDFGRLVDDPQYNLLLGNHYLSQLMDEWGGNAVLVAAAYNAGSGNVRRWIAANGDPRMAGTDVVRWIEDIPFSETRNYVQRVLENAVVYDLMNPNRGSAGGPLRNRISYFLGRAHAG